MEGLFDSVSPMFQVMDYGTGRQAAFVALLVALVIVMCLGQLDTVVHHYAAIDKDLVAGPFYDENGHEKRVTHFYADRTGDTVIFSLHDEKMAPRKEEFLWVYHEGKPKRHDSMNE